MVDFLAETAASDDQFFFTSIGPPPVFTRGAELVLLMLEVLDRLLLLVFGGKAKALLLPTLLEFVGALDRGKF